MILFVPFGPRLDRPDAVGDEGRPRAAALAAWDLGSYATGLTAEVGHAPRVRPLEYRRALRSVGVAGAGAVVAVGVGVLGGTPTTGLLPAAALAVVGIVPLVLLLRP